MAILTSKAETFDVFLQKSHEIHKESIQRALERYDKDIYCSIDHGRFELVRLDGRTILSSHGLIRFKRRYYLDKSTGEYCHLLDNRLRIPKSKRMTNELIVKLMELASIMTYKEAGEHLSDEFALSKSTVWRTIRESMVEAHFGGEISPGPKIHVQLDEKFIGMTGSKNKRRYYTLTVFAGKRRAGNSSELLNKTVMSSSRLSDLKARLNALLKKRYKVYSGDEVFLSGDLASYIQGFGESITCCRSRYVPDKFHVYKALRDSLPDVSADDISLNDRDFQGYLISRLSEIDDGNAKKLKRLLESNPKAFEPYLDPDYLGCSQECQNSHVYAPRFGKYANRFSPATIEKLALIREAKAMNAAVVLRHKRRKLPDPIDFSSSKPYESPERFALDTSGMRYETAKMFNAIKYGL